MDELQKLYNVLSRDGYYTKSFDEFVAQWEDGAYRDKVYQVVSRDGLYTKDKESFLTKYSSTPQQPTQQPEQQPVVQPTVKKKDDMESDWLFGDGSSESEPSKTEQGVDYKKAFTDYNKQLSEPKQSETDLVGRAQKVLGIKEPQQKQVGEYDPNAYIEGVATPKEPVVYIKPAPPFRNAEGGYGDVINQLDVIDKKIAESSPYEASLLILERNKLLLRKKEIEDSPVRTSDNRPFDITAPKFLEDGLNALTPKQLASYGAKGAKETFDYYFKDAGFKFETDREYVRAISPDGKEYTYNTLYPSRESLDEFKNFVRESAFNNPEIADKAYLYEKENKKFKTKEEISNEVKTISTREEQFMGDYKKMINLYRDIENIEADLKRWRDNGEKNTAKYIQTEAYLNDRLDEYNKYNVDLENKKVDLISQRTQLDKAVGKYTEFQATQGDFGGNLYRTITNTISGNFSQFLRIAVGKTIDITPMSYLLGEENYQSQRDIRINAKGYKDEKVVPISVLNKIDDEIREEFKKAAISGKIGDEKLNNILTVQGVRQAMSETLNAPITTTDEYLRERQEKGSFIERGLLGFSGSLPAMVGGPAMRYINMYLMNTDAAMQEMDNNPNFAGISENEKQLVALPIGVVSAALEEIGLKNLKLGKSITSGIIKTVIGRVPAGASASVIRNTTFDVVAEMGIKGTSAFVGGLLSEAETGILQQASEYAIKDIYESKWFKNRDMFDNPAFLSGQYLYDLYDSGRTEMVGAGVMSVPYSIAAAYQKDGFQALDDATFKIFEDLAKDDNGRKFFVTSLKNKINLGEVTPNQGKQMLEAYDQSAGMIGRVPDEITDPQSRKIAMDLISERKKLEGKKEKYDDALAKPIQDKINQINEQLTQLTQDAIQKQATGEVSLQPEAGAGQEMEVGGPEAKPKITPEESKRKEALIKALKDYVNAGEDSEILVRESTNVWGVETKKDVQAELDAIIAKEQAPVTEQGGMEQAPAKLTPEESERKQALEEELEWAALQEGIEGGLRLDLTGIYVQDKIISLEDARAELDALNQKEQAPVTEQGGMEQAEGLGTQLETVAKEEATSAKVTPTPKTTTDIITSAPIEIKGGVVVTDSDGNDVVVNGNEQVAAKLYDEAMAIPEDQRTPNQNDIVEKVQRIISQAAAETTATEVTPAEQFTEQDRARKADKRRKNITVGDTTMSKAEAKAELDALNQKEQAVQQPAAVEVAPTEVAPTEVAPTETRTAEQEADLLEELLTGKKKEPVAVEPAAVETVVEEEAKSEIPKAEEVAETDIEIKDTQTTPEEVQQQIETFDEDALPEEEKPKPGTVAELSIEDINADPERFQYKEVTDKEAGVTEQFKGKMPFRKELAGVISVWVDPADGKTYVINGHHRLDFAKRSGEKTMNVIYIDAKNASEARLKGAMQNIAEGMGTDMDAAKVFRETGMTVEQVQASGINVKGAKAMNGLSLASLSDNLFNLVTQGKLSQTVGIIIGSTIKSKEVQEQFYNVIKGKNLNNGTIKVMAEDIQAAPTENVEQMDLFGVTATEQASYQQRASFIAGIRAIVSKAKNILGKAAKSKGFLEEYGNDIDEIASETGSRESAMALAVFDRLRNTSPEIRALIDKGVERIKNGENKNKVLNETAKQIIEATPRILEGVTGQPVAGRGEVKESSAKGKQGATGKKLADAVRKNLKIKGPDGLQSNILGIPVAIWNAGVETMAKAIEVGVAINDAVKKGIDYIREKHGKKFNEAAAEKKLLIGQYKGAIEIAREAKVTNEGLKTYFKRQGLTDAQIETLLKVKEKAEKKPISKEKITGKPKPKKVTVNEMTALKDQLRLEARAAREAKGDLNTKRKMLAAAINELAKKGKISVRQAKAIVNRISSVNLDNPVMVERLLTYAENIFNDADYDTRVQEVRKLQDKVKKVNHVSMRDTVREFASINPERIPADRLLDYIQALDDMSTRTPFYQKMNDMFDEVMSYKSESKEFDAIKTFQALIDKLESIAINQVKSVEDYVALIRDINSFKRKAYQLLQNGAITQEQYDKAIENVGKDQAAVEKKYEKELAALKEKLVQEINGLKPEVHPDFTPEEAALINKYLELSDDDLKSLSPEDLYILNDLLNNIKEDVQLDYYRLSEIVSKAYTNAGGKKLAKQLNESKFNKSTDEGKKLLLEQESAFWEGLLGLGRAASGALQKFIVSPFNRAIASYENTMKDGYYEFSKLKKKYKMKDYNMHRLGMFATYLQEYMAQFDSENKDVENIGTRDWFGEIISNSSMRNGYKSAKPSLMRLIGFGDTELKTIEKIHKSLPKDANGKVDPKAVYDSFMANDSKFFTKKEKAFFDKIMDWKQKNLTTKQKAANEMNGMPFKEIPFHMMRVRLDRGAKQISPKSEGGSGVVRIEAGTGKERANQTVGPIMTNFEQLFSENLEQTARNYYLKEAINDINNTLSVAKKNLKEEKEGLFNTIPETISEALNFEFDKTESQFLASNLLAARAAETLLNPIRTAVELTSTFLSYPFRAKTPQGYKELFGKQGQMKKLLDFTSSPLRLRENINKAIDISDGRIKPKGKFEKALNYLSGLPERTMMVTSWMPTFNNEFKDITGVRFDMDKFKSDAAYRQKYGKAIKEASAVADAQTEKIIGSTTKAGGRREIRIAPKILANVFGAEGTVKKNTTAGQILGFFSNYPYREVTEFLNGFREAAEVYKQGGGALKSISQLQKPLGVVINLATYGFLSSVVYAMKLMLLGDDEDEEKGEGMLKELMTFKGFMEELEGNAISLAASKYAAGGKALLQLGATVAYNSTSDEEWKAKIKKLLKNSVFVEPIDAAKVQGYGGRNEVLGAIASYVPQIVLFAKRIEETIQTAGELKVIYDKFQEGGLSALSEDEGLAILAIDGLLKSTQALFNFRYGTSLPMYNDIKMYMKGAKKEAGVGDIKLSGTENKHKKALQNYKNEKEFKENDPEGYLKAIDEGGSLYEYKKEQSKKEEEKNKDKPFRGMSEEAFKKKYPEEYIENYGPGTEYYEEQRTPEAIEKRAEMRALQKKENAIKAKNKKKRNEEDTEE